MSAKRQGSVGRRARIFGGTSQRELEPRAPIHTFEFLEARRLLAIDTWKAAVSGDFSDATKWSLGYAPTSIDDAQITVAGDYTVTTNSGAITVNSLTIGNAASGAVVFDSNGITAPGGVTINALGTMSESGQDSAAVVNDGTLDISGDTLSGSLNNQGMLNVNGSNTISGPFTTGTNSQVVIQGINQYYPANATLTVSQAFTNNGNITFTDTGSGTRYAADYLKLSSGLLTNAPGATIAVTADSDTGHREIDAPIDNLGTFTIDQSVTWNVPLNTTSTTGSVTAVAGVTLTINGSNNNYSQTSVVDITAPISSGIDNCTLVLGGVTADVSGNLAPTAPLTSTSSMIMVTGDFIPSAAVSLTSTTLTVIGNITPTALFTGEQSTISGGGTVTVAGGETLSLNYSSISDAVTNNGIIDLTGNGSISGALANQSQILVTGSNTIAGPLTTTSASTIEIEGIGGYYPTQSQLFVTAAFTNNGLIELTDDGVVKYGSAYLEVTGLLTNAAGGTINVLPGGGGYREIDAAMDNEGTFTIGQSLTWTVPISTNSTTGSVTASSGIGLTINGADSTEGQTSTINVTSPNAWLDASPLSLNGGLINIAGNFAPTGTVTANGASISITGDFTPAAAVSLSIGTSHTLLSASGSISPTAMFTDSGENIGGGGTLTVAPGQTFSVGDATVADALINNGTVDLTGGTTLGAITNQAQILVTASNTISGALTNIGGALIEIEGVGGYYPTAAQLFVTQAFTNNGLIELTDDGVVNYAGAYLEVTGLLTNAAGATINVLPGGGGYREVDATIANSGTVRFATAANWNLGTSEALSGTFHIALGDAINLNFPMLLRNWYPGATISTSSTLPSGLAIGTSLQNVIGTPGPGAAGSYPLAFGLTSGSMPVGSLNFTLVVDGPGTQPQIALTGNGQTITDGSLIPNGGNNTSFGSTPLGGTPLSETYTVTNDGTAPLTLGAVAIAGADPADFIVTSQPANSVPVGGSTSFSVQFSPTAGGVRLATVSFSENDTTTTSPFTFSINGTATVVAAIGVSGAGQPIVDGAASTSTTNDTSFGSAPLDGTPVSETYTIANSGTAPLTVGQVTVGGTNAGDFTVTSQPTASIAPGGSTTFTVQFAPTAAGTRTATISFAENDPTTTSPFNFAVSGIASTTALSYIPPGTPYGAVNGNPIAGETLTTQRTVAEASSGAYRIVWDDATYGIETEVFNAAGAIGGPAHVANTTPTADSGATVAISTLGVSVVAWTHVVTAVGILPGGTTTDVMLQIYKGSTPSGSVITISSSSPTGSTSQPSVSMDGQDIVVAYTDSAGNGEVKAVIISSTLAQTPVTVTTLSHTSQPSVAMNAAGAFVVAFAYGATAYNEVAKGYVMAQQFQAGGAPQGSAIVVGSSSQVENQPSTAIDTAGGFVVAYTRVLSSKALQTPPPDSISYISNQTEVDASLYSATGTLLTTDTVWTSSDPTQNGYAASAAMDSSGNFVIGYTQGGEFAGGDPNDGQPGVWASSYDLNGALLQGNFGLAQNTPVYENADVGPPFTSNTMPSVALSASGNLVADWENFGLKYNGDLAGTSVFTQTFIKAPFTYQLDDGNNINLYGGMSATYATSTPVPYQLTITRDAGFTGVVSVGFAAVPTGIVVTPNADSPSQTDVRTISFPSVDDVIGTNLATQLVISGGGVSVKPNVDFNLTASAITSVSAVFGYSPAPGPNLLIPGQPATISGTGFVSGNGQPLTVEFSYTTLANGVSTPTNLNVTPTAVSADGTSLTVTVPNIPLSTTQGFTAGTITVLRPGGTSIASSLVPTYTNGGITGLSATFGYAQGYSQTYANSGSQVTINGYGFAPGDLVLFGNQLTPPKNAEAVAYYTSATDNNVPGAPPVTQNDWFDTAAAYGVAPSYINANGTSMTVNVPEDAVSGPVYIVQTQIGFNQGNDLPSPAGFTFQVYSFRNSFAFSFLNGPDGIPLDSNGNPIPNMSNSLNGQTTVPDDWADFDISLQDLNTEFPDSTQDLNNMVVSDLILAFWKSSLDGQGTCFGLDVTASLLYQEFENAGNIGPVADQHVAAPLSQANFNPAAAPVFSLAWNSLLTMDGTTRALIDTLQLNLIAQMSAYVSGAYASQLQTDIGASSSASLVQPFISQINSELAAGRPPAIGVTPAGHALLAYNVQSDGNGGYYINCYNPNDPVDSSSTAAKAVYNTATDTANKPAYAQDSNGNAVSYVIQTQAGMREEDNQDRIHLFSDGGWTWTQDDGQLFASGLKTGQLQIFAININATTHSTPYVGPAGTMSLPIATGDGLIIFGVVVVAPAALGTIGIAVAIGLDIVEAFLSVSAVRPETNDNNGNVALGPAVPGAVGANSLTLRQTKTVAASVPVTVQPTNLLPLSTAPTATNSAEAIQAGTVAVVAKPAGQPAATLWVDAAGGTPYATIQSAVNAAQPGDIIDVAPGEYDESVTVATANLTIVGGQPRSTSEQGASIVRGDAFSFDLNADNITLQGFTVDAPKLSDNGIVTEAVHSGYQILGNTLEMANYGLVLNTLTNGNGINSSTVSGNTFQNNLYGIYSSLGMSNVTISTNNFTGDADASVQVAGTAQSSNVQILDNQVIDDAAIVLQNVMAATIEGNTITNPLGTNYDGISLNGSVTMTQVSQNKLQTRFGRANGIASNSAGNINNTFATNTISGFVDGLLFDAATGDMITGNTVDQNSSNGIELTDNSENNSILSNQANDNAVGILLLVSNDNAVSKNTAEYNLIGGIFVEAADNDQVTDNTTDYNTGGAEGILVFGDSNTVSGNTADGNSVGIVSALGTNSTVSDNQANNNLTVGIMVQQDVNAAGQMDTVSGNTVDGNQQGGIDAVTSTYVMISGNTVDDNLGYGIAVQNPAEAMTYDTIAGNTVNKNQPGDGILLSNDDQTSITGNTTDGNGADGIGLRSSNHDTVSDNQSNTNLNDGIDLDTASSIYTLADNTTQANGSIPIELPPTVSIVAVSPSPRNAPVSQIAITFSEPVFGFTLTDLRLSKNSGADLIGGSSASLSTTDNIHWTLSGLAPLTDTAGKYTLTLAQKGISDAGGDGLVAADSSSFTVNQVAPTALLSSSLNPATFGQALTMTMTIGPAFAGGPTPTGTVLFTNTYGAGTQIWGTVSYSQSNGNLLATVYLTNPLAPGAHIIHATYSGDSNFLGVTSTLTQIVNPVAPSATLASSLNPSTYGQPVTLSMTLGPAFAGAPTPKGTVLFTDATNGRTYTLGSGETYSVVNGKLVASVTFTNSLAAGTHTIKASYSGDNYYYQPLSETLSQVVARQGTTTAVSTAPNPAVAGKPVSLTATVAGVASTAGTVLPTGKVTFYDGSTKLGSGTLGNVAGVATATLNVASLPVGTNSITAVYAGDANYLTSTSPDPEEIVEAAGKLDVNGDGAITPIDALQVINYLNASTTGSKAAVTAAALAALDVNGDGAITPIDALIVINYLNSRSQLQPTGQSTASASTASQTASAAAQSFAVAANSTASGESKRGQSADALFASYADLGS